MARRPALIKKKTKTEKKTKSEHYLINLKYLGVEPHFTSAQISGVKHSKCLQWYNTMCTLSEAKEYLIEYLRNVGRDDEAKRISQINDKWMPTTACWNARMWGRGANLPDGSHEFFESRLKEVLQRDYSKARMELSSQEDEPTTQEPKPSQKPSVQDRMKAKISDFIGGIEEIIDDFTENGYTSTFSMYEHLRGNDIPPVQVTRIIDFYDPQLCEIEDAYNGVPEVLEGYMGYSKENLEKLYDFFVMLVTDAERYRDNEKKTRKPRTPKPVTADKKLKDFKHMPAHPLLKLQSIRPETILGAGELWTFSTKYNQLSVFRMASGAGLDVHRTAITNYDTAASFTKKLKAKDVAHVLGQVLTGGKIVLRNLMPSIKGSDQKLQERMNENTILLRVVPK